MRGCVFRKGREDDESVVTGIILGVKGKFKKIQKVCEERCG